MAVNGGIDFFTIVHQFIRKCKIIAVPFRMNNFALHNIFRRQPVKLCLDQGGSGRVFFFNLPGIYSRPHDKILFKYFFQGRGVARMAGFFGRGTAGS